MLGDQSREEDINNIYSNKDNDSVDDEIKVKK